MSEKNKLSGKTIPKKELVRELTRENPNYTFNEAYDLINSVIKEITLVYVTLVLFRPYLHVKRRV